MNEPLIIRTETDAEAALRLRREAGGLYSEARYFLIRGAERRGSCTLPDLVANSYFGTAETLAAEGGNKLAVANYLENRSKKT